MASPSPLLRVEQLEVAYGDVQVLWDVDLEIQAGEIVALVGSNGAGKSTLLSTIGGLLAPRAGEIRFEGRSIGGADARRVVGLGITLVPEGRRLFPAMTVRDQLKLGAFMRDDRAQIEADIQRVLDLFPRLKERLDTLAGKLSGGEQQMTAIGRALMARPRLLMIDELSLGLAPVLVESLMEIIARINREGTTILMVEQDVLTALEVANRGYVIETGQITLSGPAAALLDDERVKQAYLGTAVLAGDGGTAST
ncbi:MAG TPA: ABC transporter ATP-binding protein [Chloroflexota bacterium]|jgi:branched-chain amino acid transport system ATP-binding protein